MDTIEIIGIAASTIAIVLGGVWFIVQHAMNSAVDKHRLDSVEQKTNALPCERNHDDIRQGIAENKAILKRMEDSDAKMNDLPCMNHHSDITAIKSILIQKYPNAANVFSMKASPRKLNSTGEKVYDDINGELFLLENKNKFFEYIDKNSPLKPLDVEQYAYASLLYYTGTDIFNNIKDYVYNAKSIIKEDGERYDIALNDVCYVLSIPLRDMYLMGHPDIS